MAQCLAAGGCGPNFSKLVANEIFAQGFHEACEMSQLERIETLKLNPKPEDLDKNCMAIWSSESEVGEHVASVTKEHRAAKEDALREALLGQPKWQGTQGVMSTVDMPEAICGLEWPQEHTEGQKPWMLCFRRNGKRHGCSSFSCMGAASLFHIGEHAVIFVVGSIEKLLGSGIVIENYELFLESEHAQKFLEGGIFMAPAGSVVYTPPDSLIHAFYHKSDKDVKDSKMGEATFLVHFPWLSSQATKLVSTRVASAVIDANTRTFQQKTKNMWKARAEAFAAAWVVQDGS